MAATRARTGPSGHRRPRQRGPLRRRRSQAACAAPRRDGGIRKRSACPADPRSSPAWCRTKRTIPVISRPGHQHPPQLPAELHRRAAVPAGVPPRREAHRRHVALRDRGPRRM